ncbi:PREDICTED: tyrosine-protein kinase fyna-like [Nicrophorus vespilloides]|uniref:Tyrosine-protein kinase n=1 Tax=Nicrophorus vespilloides TaxID=110193 RepID=A0ABM1MJN7_NICVS|nr:PREDICTED: tyrosine-protein kinase fyna-like [Nicrophorus vespilloides]
MGSCCSKRDVEIEALPMLNQQCNFIATHDFTPDSKNDLELRKGDIVQFIDDDFQASWRRATKNGEIGYVPTCYLAQESSLESEPWYMPDLNQISAEQLLLQKNNSNGAFLVRRRLETEDTAYALSLRDDDDEDTPKVKHYKIFHENDMYFVSPKIEKFTLQELIKLYHIEDVKNILILKLLKPCWREEPHLTDLSGKFVKDWEIDRKNVKIVKAIGKGQGGDIFLGNWKKRKIAVKILHGHFDKQEFTNEVEIMKKQTHKNIVSLYGICTKKHPFQIMMEYMEYGSLQDYLTNPPKGITSPNVFQLHYMICQIASGMEYLAGNGIIHRDLATRNVLIGPHLLTKISDFGLSRYLESKEIYQSQMNSKLPIMWLAPESFEGLFSTKSDVWTFGHVVMEMFNECKRPYDESQPLNQQQLKNLIQSGYKMPKPARMPDSTYRILLTCWELKPEDRPSFTDLLNSFSGHDTYSDLTKN